MHNSINVKIKSKSETREAKKIKKARSPKVDDSFKLNAILMKGSMIFALFSLIVIALFLGFVDFITPHTLTTFNIDNLNAGGLITYAKSDEPSSSADIWDLISYVSAGNSSSVFSSSYSKLPAENKNDGSIASNANLEKSAESAKNGANGSSAYVAKLFGIFPVRKVDITVFTETHLIPGGIPFGVRFFTEGVIVVGTSDIETEKGVSNPAKNAGIKTADVIVAINGAPISTVDEISRLIEGSKGETISISVIREGKPYTLSLKPVMSDTEKKYKSGIWLRDTAAGIGTVTFINPENNAFGGLGHGICDVDTGTLMPLRRGTIVNASIDNVVRGKSEVPGELKGKFKDNSGTLLSNTNNGIFGILTNAQISPENATPLPIGLRSEIKEGKAVILSTVDNNGVREFEIEIIKIYKNSNDSKNFLVKITDPELIEITGGIVQGMSGSPVIQDGKIIGAVTHVLVSDPAKGYGIFIDNMLNSMPDTLRTEE